MGEGGSGEIERSNSRVMDYVLNDLHHRLGLVQFNLAHMMSNKPDRKLVQCRPLNAGNPTFRMEFGLDDSYKAVAARVAYKLHVLPEKIKLTLHNCSCNLVGYVGPDPDPDPDGGYPFNCLRDILVDPHTKTTCDVLHYYVLGAPPRNTKTAEVAYGGYPNAKQSFKCVVRGMRSSDPSYWLPTTVQLCRLLSTGGQWIEKVLEDGLVHILLYFLTVKNPELQVEAAKALKYLASGTSEVVDTLRTTNQEMNSTYGALWQLLHSENDMVLSHVCCSLAVLSGCNVEFEELVCNPELFFRIYELTRHRTLNFVALRTVGNLMLRDARLISYLHLKNGDVLHELGKFLTLDFDVHVRREACWVISYIAAGSWCSYLQDKFFDGLIKPLVEAMKNDEFVVVEAAVWAVSNATFGATSEQIKVMFNEGCIDMLCELLCYRDLEIFEACLEGLENILKVGEEGKGAGVNPYAEHMKSIKGWRVLEVACRFYQKKMLYKRSLELMVKYGILSPSRYEQRMRQGHFGAVFV